MNPPPLRRALGGHRAGRVMLALALAVAVVLICAACGDSSNLTASLSTAPDDGAGNPLPTVSATTTAPGATVTGPAVSTPGSLKATVLAGADAAVAPTSTRQGFLGIASELSTITRLSGPAGDQDTAFVQLLKNLSPGAPFLLRLGGDSADWSWWAIPGQKKPAGIRYTLTPQWAADVQALLKALDGRALLGINLEQDSKRLASAEVADYDKYVGTNLIDDFELGNEPELYAGFNYYRLPDGIGVKGRVQGQYTLAEYGRDFSDIAAALGRAPLGGPSSGSPAWLPDLGTMLHELPARLALVTVHAYPLKRCSSSTHIPMSELLAGASIQGLAESVHAMVRTAAAHGKPLRLDEINGVSCGGQPGVSNAFGEALWALNVLPALWQAGVQGVNFQTITGNLNQMIAAKHSGAGWSVSVEPEYYGLLTFADAAPAGSHLLHISGSGPAGLLRFAVRAPNGSERVILTNLGPAARSVGVSALHARGIGTVSLLSAKSLSATNGTTLAGQRLSATTGQLIGTPSYTLVKPNAAGVYSVRVPAHAAAVLTLST